MNERQTRGRDELRRLIRRENGSKGIRYGDLGFGFGSSVKQHAITGRSWENIGGSSWASAPLLRHDLSGLIVHHERLNIRRITWHLDHYDDLMNGVRPMLLLIHEGRRFIVDGCHRSAVLVLCGFTAGDYLTYDYDLLHP